MFARSINIYGVVRWYLGFLIPTTGNPIVELGLHLVCKVINFNDLCLFQKTSVKFSGLKPLMYTNCKKMVQNLLELDSDKLTTSVLCAALQCMGVQSLADQILQEYQKQAKMVTD